MHESCNTKAPDPHRHLASFRRSLWEERDIIVVVGPTAPLHQGRRAYGDLYRVAELPDERATALDRLLVAAGLAAVSLADRESWGWSMNLPGLPYGLFAAVEPEGAMCGTSRDAEPSGEVVVLQRQKQDGPIVQSHLEAPSHDPAAAVQRYFIQVEQVATRLAVDDDGGALLQALPGGELGDLQTLDDDALLDLARELSQGDSLSRLEEVILFYDCRCDASRVAKMLDALDEEQRREIWAGGSSLDVECPRCGREFVIRNDAGND